MITLLGPVLSEDYYDDKPKLIEKCDETTYMLHNRISQDGDTWHCLSLTFTVVNPDDDDVETYLRDRFDDIWDEGYEESLGLSYKLLKKEIESIEDSIQFELQKAQTYITSLESQIQILQDKIEVDE